MKNNSPCPCVPIILSVYSLAPRAHHVTLDYFVPLIICFFLETINPIMCFLNYFRLLSYLVTLMVSQHFFLCVSFFPFLQSRKSRENKAAKNYGVFRILIEKFYLVFVIDNLITSRRGCVHCSSEMKFGSE